MDNGPKINKDNDIVCDIIPLNFQLKRGEPLQISCKNNCQKPILKALRFHDPYWNTDIQPQNHFLPRHNSESKPEVIKPKLKKSNSLTRYFLFDDNTTSTNTETFFENFLE